MQRRHLILGATHLATAAGGFGLGIYLLPILAAPPAPSAGEARAAAGEPLYRAPVRRDLPGSDPLHWGEGELLVGRNAIALVGELAPGPAYRLYLVPGTVETGAQFLAVKARALPVGEIRTFRNFTVPLAAGVPLEAYDSAVVWCEAFSQFITSARYRSGGG